MAYKVRFAPTYILWNILILVDVGSPTHSPHVEASNSCVGLYIMGGPIVGGLISPTNNR